MQVPLEISYKDVDKSEWIEKFIQEKVDKLQRLAREMISCRVAVEKDHQRRHGENPFYVRVETSLPGKKRLATASEDLKAGDDSSTDLQNAIREAFEAMERRLKKAKGDK